VCVVWCMCMCVCVCVCVCMCDYQEANNMPCGSHALHAKGAPTPTLVSLSRSVEYA